MHVSHRSIYNIRSQSRLLQLRFPQPLLPFKRKSYSSLIVRVVMEFTQFTGITFGKVKGHVEVTVSAWVSGWPLGRGGGDRSRRGIVCCSARRRLTDAHSNQRHWDRRQKVTTYYLPFKMYIVIHDGLKAPPPNLWSLFNTIRLLVIVLHVALLHWRLQDDVAVSFVPAWCHKEQLNTAASSSVKEMKHREVELCMTTQDQVFSQGFPWTCSWLWFSNLKSSEN